MITLTPRNLNALNASLEDFHIWSGHSYSPGLWGPYSTRKGHDFLRLPRTHGANCDSAAAVLLGLPRDPRSAKP